MKERLPKHAEHYADLERKKLLKQNKNNDVISKHFLHYLGLDEKRYVLSHFSHGFVLFLDKKNLYRKIGFNFVNNGAHDLSLKESYYFDIYERFYDDNIEVFLENYFNFKSNSISFVESLNYEGEICADSGSFHFEIIDNKYKETTDTMLALLSDYPNDYDFTLDDYHKTKRLNTTYSWRLPYGAIPFDSITEFYTSIVFREVFNVDKLHVDDFRLISQAYSSNLRNESILKFIDEKPDFFDLIEFDKNDILTKDSIELFNINYKK